VFPYEDDPVVISVITIGQNVHRVLIDQGSSTDVMFWGTFVNLQISLDQIMSYDDCLVGFAGDQVEVQGYVKLSTTFSDKNATRTITVKYIVINTPSMYNLFLGRPSLNRTGVVAFSAHMKMKLPSLEGKVITMRVDQKITRKCYENNLKSCRRTYTITAQLGGLGSEAKVDSYDERRPGPAGEVRELEIKGKNFKLKASLCKELEDKLSKSFQRI